MLDKEKKLMSIRKCTMSSTTCDSNVPHCNHKVGNHSTANKNNAICGSHIPKRRFQTFKEQVESQIKVHKMRKEKIREVMEGEQNKASSCLQSDGEMLLEDIKHEILYRARKGLKELQILISDLLYIEDVECCVDYVVKELQKEGINAGSEDKNDPWIWIEW
jgi:hypothetical protein